MIPVLIGAGALVAGAVLIDDKAPAEKKRFPIKRVCAWCKQSLGEPEHFGPVPGLVSHGICENCKTAMKKEAGK